MTIRYAFFEGTIHPGRENEFKAFVEERLVPLWVRFPGCEKVCVSFEVEHDEGVSSCPMILAFHYPDMPTLRRSLDSDVRTVSRGVTAELLGMFDGRVRHHIVEAAPGAAAGEHAFAGLAVAAL